MLDSLDDALGEQSSQNLLDALKSTTDPEEKVSLWNQLSIVVFTRCLTLILATSYLTALTHIQLSILAGYTYKQLVSSQYYNKSNHDKTHAEPNNLMLSMRESDQEAYLSDATNTFLLHGVSQIHQFLLQDVIPKVIGDLKLSQCLTLQEISDLLRSMVQCSLSTGWFL